MNVLRDVIERRINVFGVSEPVVRVERIGFTGAESEQQLIVELPGVTDIDKAVAMIGATPSSRHQPVHAISDSQAENPVKQEVNAQLPGYLAHLAA